MKNITIDDIARVAGVSKSTVSRVLNGTAKVHPDKKKAVEEATERLGFQPNVVASSLARGRSMTIGVLTQLMGTPFYDAISQGVIAEFNDTPYSPIFVDGQWQKGEEVDAIRALIGRRVDGLVLIGGSVPSSEIANLCSGLPTVIVGRNLPGHKCVYMNNEACAYEATKYLIAQGHRDIAVIRGLEHHQDAVDRFAGYQRALLEAGLPLKQELVQSGDFSADSGLEIVGDLLRRNVSFTAVLAANDLTAMGVRLALYRNDIPVPEKVSIIGFDDQLEAAYMSPPLTTVKQPSRKMGSYASQCLLKMIDGKSIDSICVDGELVQRESVASIQ
ncbi:MAG: LacI family DNA-binding transcriptional regulator [Planctomycetota bacterium]